MEIVSKQARQLLKNFMSARDDDDVIIYDNHKNLIESDDLALEELIKLDFCFRDLAHNIHLNRDGKIFLRQYKTFTRQVWLTSFWLPLFVSIVGTALTLYIQCLLFQK